MTRLVIDNTAAPNSEGQFTLADRYSNSQTVSTRFVETANLSAGIDRLKVAESITGISIYASPREPCRNRPMQMAIRTGCIMAELIVG